ncbi:hypothetical protein [Microbacter margulisiae]|uniref:Uncharacterized protein n=1 Tax=Microbacter margulisiae TaxID=1350067 RepID=A0A7W5DQJ3_9PORP|nr:hypothetical protein [Microbacter margulisiae]MBB3187229.1 hypothetical protein [Microbacter margulisiae]
MPARRPEAKGKKQHSPTATPTAIEEGSVNHPYRFDIGSIKRGIHPTMFR